MDIEKEKYKANLKSMFITCFTSEPSIKSSMNEILEQVAVDHGRTSSEAKQDVKKNLCLKSAIEILIEKSADQC